MAVTRAAAWGTPPYEKVVEDGLLTLSRSRRPGTSACGVDRRRRRIPLGYACTRGTNVLLIKQSYV
eukprot:703528-Rhodomonas_salina.1